MSYEIQATVREAQGTGASRRLRREGQTPAVLYGEDQKGTAIAVDHKTVYYALAKEDFHTALIKLSVGGKEYKAIVRDFQFHPFRQEVQHIDFQIVDENKPLKLRVPLHVVNAEKSQAIKLQSGRVSRAFATVQGDLRQMQWFHTDRGSEFKNEKINELLKTFEIGRSLSMKGCPYDNAVAEATYKIMKTEFIHQMKFHSLYHLELELYDYVNWFNNHRIHGTLGYLTPVQFRNQALKKVV